MSKIKKLGNLLIGVYILTFSSYIFGWDIVFDPDVFARLGEELGRMDDQLGKLQTQITHQETQIKNQKTEIDHLENSRKGLDKPYEWSETKTIFDELTTNAEKLKAIAYNASDVNQKFTTTFPGYTSALNSKGEHDFDGKYKDIITAVQNTLNFTLQSLNRNSADFKEENGRINKIQAHVQGAVGQTQAIQAASELAHEQVTQLQLLRQTVMAQASAQNAYFAAQTQKEAYAKKNLDDFLNKGNTSTDTKGCAECNHKIKLPHSS